MKTTKRTIKKIERKQSLIGLFLHTYEHGEMKLQGQIIGLQDDKVLVQLFEWWMGEPTNVEAFDRTFIYSIDCKLYQHEDVWKARGNAEFSKQED